jgi:hypothetical protein
LELTVEALKTFNRISLVTKVETVRDVSDFEVEFPAQLVTGPGRVRGRRVTGGKGLNRKNFRSPTIMGRSTQESRQVSTGPPRRTKSKMEHAPISHAAPSKPEEMAPNNRRFGPPRRAIGGGFVLDKNPNPKPQTPNSQHQTSNRSNRRPGPFHSKVDGRVPQTNNVKLRRQRESVLKL